MTYSFHPHAEIEFNQAIDYYEECQVNLGLEFAEEVYGTIQRILAFPNAWQLLDDGIRRCLTNRFPFGVIYYQREQEIIILAVMQLNRKPDYWIDRVS
jgi:plasmid stabilization system protein ParE